MFFRLIYQHFWSAYEMDTYKREEGKIFHGDCLEAMKELEDESVVLQFTSPPYFNAINYDEHIDKLQGDKDRWEREDIPYDEYRKFLVDRFRELYRVIKPGGHNIVNISPVHWDGERIALPFHFVTWMEEIGWKFKEDIIWEKPVAKDRRSGVIIQHPYPGYYYPSVVAEYVLVFQKEAETESKNNIYWFRDEDEKEENELNLDDFQGEQSKNVWKIRPVAPGENVHPCPFPVELAERVIKFYSYKGDQVLDIFMGSGQCMIAAQNLEREYIGMETQKEYIDYTMEQLKKSSMEQQKALFDEEEL